LIPILVDAVKMKKSSGFKQKLSKKRKYSRRNTHRFSIIFVTILLYD
jgi:hypothetical protein